MLEYKINTEIISDAEELSLEKHLEDLDRQGKYWTHAYAPDRDIMDLKFFLEPKPAHWGAVDQKRERARLPSAIARCERWLGLDHDTCFNPAKAKAQAAEISALLPAIKPLL
jgi:hypothetical protein